MRSNVLSTIGISVIVGALLLSGIVTACAQSRPPTWTPAEVSWATEEAEQRYAAQTATREARWAQQTAVIEETALARATREAKQAVATTFRAENPPSPTPPSITPSGLLNDIQAVTWHMEALNPIIADCVARGTIDGREHAPFFNTAGTIMLDISDDAADGVMDQYDERYVRKLTQDIHAKLDELERQCMR